MAKRGKRRGKMSGKGAIDTPFQDQITSQARKGKRGRKGRGKSRR